MITEEEAKGIGGKEPGQELNKLRMRRVREAQRTAKEVERVSSPIG